MNDNEISLNEVVIDVNNNTDIKTEVDISLTTAEPIEIYIEPREYKIIGDDIYIPINYESSPQWLQNTINTLTNVKVDDVVTNLNDLINQLTYAVGQVELAKNRYEQSILAVNTIDSRFNAVDTTLNSSMNALDASLKDIIATKVTNTQAAAIALSSISSALNDTAEHSLGSVITQLQTSITNLNTTTNTSLISLSSNIVDSSKANADAIDIINTYIGIDDVGASTHTGLSAYLEGSDGTIGGADSQLANTIKVTSAGVESKFAYNSVVNVNGIYKKSGFGLSTNYTSGSGTLADPYVSEFWIDASKLKFTNSNQTGSVAPFTIDATGTTPQITFNGKVAFTNVNGLTLNDNTTNMIKNSEFINNVNPWALGWNPNGSTIEYFNLAENVHSSHWIIKGTTGSLTLGQAGRNSSTAYDDTGIDIYPQGGWDLSKGYSVIAGNTYEFSTYVACHRSQVRVGIYIYDSSENLLTTAEPSYITPATGGTTLESYSRIYTRVTIPAGGCIALLYVRKKNTDAGQSDSWIWIARPFFGKVNPNSIAPVDYIASDSANTILDTISWQSQVQTALNNNATYIDGAKLTTGSIAASKINTSGLIAENINATEIIGKNITGGKITGARIEGSVIVASYLDLNGQLQVLTNYVISVATRNSNPSLYSDAVYMSSTNDYRIPSLSSISEPTVSQDISNSGSVFNSKIRSYNCANAGHNLKCVKYNPTMNFSSMQLFSLYVHLNSIYSNIWLGTSSIFEGKKSNQYQLFICGQHMGTYYLKHELLYSYYPPNDGSSYDFYGLAIYFNGTRYVNSFNVSNGTFSITVTPEQYTVNNYTTYNVPVKWNFTLNTGSFATSFTDSNIGLIKAQNDGGRTFSAPWVGSTITEVANMTVNSNITVNNMV